MVLWGRQAVTTVTFSLKVFSAQQAGQQVSSHIARTLDVADDEVELLEVERPPHQPCIGCPRMFELGQWHVVRLEDEAGPTKVVIKLAYTFDNSKQLPFDGGIIVFWS